SLVKEPEAFASAAAFPSAAKRELTPPGPACQQLFFRTPKFFSERAARVSPRRRSGNLSRPLLAVNCFLLLFSKNRYRAVTVTTQQLQVVFNTQPKHLHTLPQTPLSVNHFLNFFSKTFSSQYPTFLFYCTMRICVFRDDTHEKSPERGLPGPSHQFA
ncbi:hypothetical protein, partial [Bilophila wadsworthia]|uniref:hypothetical protein n=1 Tax=Bilophila wadsworthia TaxID=35833 RepID=UPI0032C08427